MDKLQTFYNNMSKHYSLPDFNQFKIDMQNPSNRQKIYNNASKYFSMPDFKTFQSDLFDNNQKINNEANIPNETLIEDNLVNTAIKSIAPTVGSAIPHEDLNKQLQKQLMPEVTSTATNLHELPEFDAFRKKYGFNNTFGLDKLPQFYDKAKSLNDYEALGDYENLVDNIKNKLGSKALYQGMNISQASFTQPENERSQKLLGIANSLEGVIRGEGGIAAFNPITGIVGAIDKGLKESAIAQDALAKGDYAGAFLQSIQAGADIPFTVGMSLTPGGQVINAATSIGGAVAPDVTKWMAPVSEITKPTSLAGKSLAALADMGIQFGVAHAFGLMSDKGKSDIKSSIEKYQKDFDTNTLEGKIQAQKNVLYNVLDKTKGNDRLNITKEISSLSKMQENVQNANNQFKQAFDESGVRGDFKGVNINKGNVTGVGIDAEVDPNNPNPALRRSYVSFKPENFTPENIKSAVETSQRAFEDNQPAIGRMLSEGKKPEDIAKALNVPVEDVNKLQKPQPPEGFEEVKSLTSNYYDTPPDTKIDESGKIAGISNRVLDARAQVNENTAPESGIGWNAQEALNRGNYLRTLGENSQQVLDRFKKTGGASEDDLAIVRSELHDLQKSTNRVGDIYGKDSQQYKDALAKEDNLQKEAQPIKTMFARGFQAMQGYEPVDIDYDSKSGQIRYFETVNKGRSPNEFELNKIKELSLENKRFADLNEDLQAKMQKLLNDNAEQKLSSKMKGSVKLSSKEFADKIRRAKIHRPGAFMAATPASLAWDAGVETVAQIVEQGGKLVDAVQKGLDKIKETDWYKGLTADKQKEAETQFKNWHNNQSTTKIDLSSLREYFTDKKDNKFTPKEANAVWQYAKDNYIDSGKMSHQDMVKNISQDLGLTIDQTINALATLKKEVKPVSDEIYRIQNKRRNFQRQNKAWLDSRGASQWSKFISQLPSRFFGWYVLGHGTVFGQTHAGMELFRPTAWKNYFPALIRQFKYSYGDLAVYEKGMEQLQSDPNYILAKRAGLANDPNRIYDDYMLTDKFFGKLGLIGERGFNSWKIYRQDMFNAEWNKLSDAVKADKNTAKTIADMVNHSTGTTTEGIPGTIGKVANTVFFAPRLEASRWARLIQEPATMIKNYIDWGLGKLTGKEISPSEKFQAKLIFKRNAEIIATMATMLAANEGLNLLTKSKQHVNFLQPYKSDWLRFKAGGKVIDWSGGVLSAMTLTARLLDAAVGSQKTANKLSRGKGRGSLMLEDVGKYALGKLSPIAGTSFSAASHHDYAGNTLPPFKDKPLYKDAKHLSWFEYISSEQMPIPIAEGIKDIYDTMQKRGMSKPQIETILNGIFISLVAGGTGARVREEYKNEYKK